MPSIPHRPRATAAHHPHALRVTLIAALAAIAVTVAIVLATQTDSSSTAPASSPAPASSEVSPLSKADPQLLRNHEIVVPMAPTAAERRAALDRFHHFR